LLRELDHKFPNFMMYDIHTWPFLDQPRQFRSTDSLAASTHLFSPCYLILHHLLHEDQHDSYIYNKQAPVFIYIFLICFFLFTFCQE